MNVTEQYFKPLNSLLHCKFSELELHPVTALVIASYFTLIVPVAFLVISCLKGRVKPEAPEGSPKVDQVAKGSFNKGEAERIYNLADQYRKEKNYTKAFECYKKAAELGLTDAHNDLGFCYGTGSGTEQNYELALKHYHIASNLGLGVSTLNLGIMHDTGKGCEENPAKAAELYQKAIDQGYTPAAFNLAILYEEGIGVEKDEKKALELLKSLQFSNENATIKLAEFYIQGKGCTKNFHEALFLLRLFSKNPHSLYLQGLLYLKGNGVKENKKIAYELLKKASDLGSFQACKLIAHMYFSGDGIEKDKKKAFEYLSLAYSYNEKNLHTLCWLGTWYMRGEGVNQDLSKAKEYFLKGQEVEGKSWDVEFEELGLWEKLQNEEDAETLFQLGDDLATKDKFLTLTAYFFKKAADKGHAEAQFHAGYYFSEGIGVDIDQDQGKHYFILSANQGNAVSMYYLGGMESDPKASLEWYKKSAEKELGPAQYVLGKLYAEGKECERDVKFAFKLISKAYDQGYMDAAGYLGYLYYEGIGTVTNFDAAFQFLSEAYENHPEDTFVLYWLGALYMRGHGVARDTNMARELLEKGKALNADEVWDGLFKELADLEALQKQPEDARNAL